MDKIAKAIVAATVGFGGGYTIATAGGTGVTRDEWVAIAVATVVGFFSVWATPNKSAKES